MEALFIQGKIEGKRGLVRIAHVITGLETGGSQRSLLQLIRSLDHARLNCIVISLRPPDSMSEIFLKAGIEAYHLGIKKEPFSLSLGTARLLRILKGYQPHILQGWMYHANLACTLAARCLPYKPKVIWGIRHSLENMRMEKRSTAWMIQLGARLSRSADKIVYNAYSSADQHGRLGYNDKRCLVIRNGFDLKRFRPSRQAREWLRKELVGVGEDQLLVGMVGRFHPMKGHDIFLEAAGEVARGRENLRFLLVGKGLNKDNARINSMIRKNGVEGKVYLMGERFDTEKIYPGLDMLCSSSFGESFPNVVGEAMACGVPCVVTNVGDSALILRDCGRVVPPGDVKALAAALSEIIQCSPEIRAEMGVRARKRMESFSCEQMVESFALLYRELVAEKLPAKTEA